MRGLVGDGHFPQGYILGHAGMRDDSLHYGILGINNL